MRNPTPSDADLVREARDGSAAASHELVRRFERPLLSLIVRMVHDRALAEDLAQESFIKAFRHLDRFDETRKFSSWLFKIAHNTTLDHLRRHNPETVALDAQTRDGEESWEVLEAPGTTAPDRRAESSELLVALERALARLPPHYREILLLRFREGLAYQELAEALDLNLGTVKIQIHRARKRLAQELAELGFENPGERA